MSRRLVLAFLAVAVAVAGCARDSNKQQTNPAAPRSSAPRAANPAPEPYGRLSVAEYRAIVHEYRLLAPLQNGSDDPQALARGKRVCEDLTDPQTTLVVRVRADCNNAIAFFGGLRALERAGDECGGRSQRDRLLCAHSRYVALAKAIAATSAGAVAINSELRQRGITGLCARSIGITAAQLALYRRAEQAAREGADALNVGDALGVQRATQALTAALTGGSSDDPLVGIERGCHTAKTKPLPRVPRGGGINA